MKVLLLHGWPLDETMWDGQVPRVREWGLEPVAPRLYGRGAAIDGWAAQLLGEVDGPFVAVGASMGGYCALALARRAPERVVGIVLAGSRAEADTPERRQGREETISTLREGVVPPGIEYERSSGGPRGRAGGDAGSARPLGRRGLLRRAAARVRR